MKTFRAVIYSILSLALSGFCFYKIYASRNLVPAIRIDITDNAIITYIINSAMKLANGEHSVIVAIIGIAAMILYTVTAFPLHEFFSNLPLGSIKKIDYSKSPKAGFILFSSLSPALIIGIFTATYLLVQYYISEKNIETDIMNDFVKWGLPLTILLTVITFVVLIIKIIVDGGLWGVLIRFPLLLTENICLSIIMGVFIAYCVFFIPVLVMNFFVLIFAIIALLLYPLINKIKT